MLNILKQRSDCHEHYACVCHKAEIAEVRVRLKCAEAELRKFKRHVGNLPVDPSTRDGRSIPKHILGIFEVCRN